MEHAQPTEPVEGRSRTPVADADEAARAEADAQPTPANASEAAAGGAKADAEAEAQTDSGTAEAQTDAATDEEGPAASPAEELEPISPELEPALAATQPQLPTPETISTEAVRVQRPTSLVPVEPVRRISVWKRISMRRAARRAREVQEAQALAASNTRLETIERQVAGFQETLAVRFDRMEQRFVQFWEMEEQLGQLAEIAQRLDEIRSAQEELKASEEALRSSVRRVGFATTLVAVGLLAAAMVWLASAA